MHRTRLAALAAIPFVIAACGGSSSTTSSSSGASAAATGTVAAPTAATATGAVPGSTGATSAAAAPATTPAEITVASTKFGKAITDAKGMTLYLFQPDTTSKSTCYGTCATAWPPLLSAGTPKVAGGLDKSKIGVTKRTDGTLQVTYDGHPLYYFVGDTSVGAVTGQHVNANGGLWLLVKPSGAPDMAT